MPNVNHETVLVAFVALTAVAVLLQAIVLLALFLTIRATTKHIEQQVAEFRAFVEPAVNEAKDFVARVGPKIDAAATDLVEVSHALRAQGLELQTSALDIMQRVRRQTTRVDAMFSGILDTFDRAQAIVGDALNLPLRQIGAMAAFARAAIGALRSRGAQPQPQPTHSPADKDLFV